MRFPPPRCAGCAGLASAFFSSGLEFISCCAFFSAGLEFISCRAFFSSGLTLFSGCAPFSSGFTDFSGCAFFSSCAGLSFCSSCWSCCSCCANTGAVAPMAKERTAVLITPISFIGVASVVYIDRLLRSSTASFLLSR